MIKNIYNKFYKSRFFNKILLVNTLILITALLMLALIVSFNVGSMLQQKEIVFNTQLLQSIGNYMEQRYRTSINMLQQMYLENSKTTPRILDFIQQDYDKLSDEYISDKTNFDNYLVSNFYRDSDIQDIVIYKQSSNSYFFSERNKPLIREIDTSARKTWGFENETANGFRMLPTRTPDYVEDGKIVYSLAAIITTRNVMEKIGEIVIDYDPYTIRNAYSEYAKDVKGTLLVLTNSGSVIYDSSNQYYGGMYPNFHMLNTSERNTYIDNDMIINIVVMKKRGLIIAGIIPKSEILASIKKTRSMIFIVTVICIAASLCMTFVGVSVFSRRIKIIINAMKKVRTGDFSVKFSLKDQQDEIGEIAANFEVMCHDLKEHINKVYVSSIKQKSAELKALQSQVNPHFLYNTLETIRMRALAKGNEDVGDMMCILAALFRSSIKEEMIILIRDELKYCRMYLDLFKIRYKDGLSYQFEIAEDILEYGIIRHLIQPVIENYIIHGIKQGEEDNRFCVKGSKEAEDILLEFSDNGNGISNERFEIIKRNLENFDENDSTSIGLANVNERIKIIFGMQYGLEIFSIEGTGTKVTLRIPAKTRKELTDYVQSFNC